MQIGVVAVAGEHLGERLVGGAVDLILALTEAERQDPSLPPGQDGLAVVGLRLEVGRGVVRRCGVEPDQVAGLIDDHLSRRARALIGRQEEIAGRRAGARRRRDRHRRRDDRRRREVVLDRRRAAAVVRELLLADRRLEGDAEARSRGRRGCALGDARGDADALAGDERPGGDEALTSPRRVRLDLAAVAAAARADDVDVGDRRTRAAEEADLGGRRCVGGTRERRHGDRVDRGLRDVGNADRLRDRSGGR